MYNIVHNAWQMVASDSKAFADPLPEDMRRRNGLISLREAIYNIHFPQSADKLRAAQYRLKYDELLGVQLTIQARRTARHHRANGFLFPRVGHLFNTFYREKLPFALTGAQQRVIKEIRSDMISGRQMNRLLQGDVGSGKTMVAAAAAYFAIQNGHQAAMMAPTEILAEQHYHSLSRLLSPLGLRLGLLTGSMKEKEKKAVRAALATGLQRRIGTNDILTGNIQHALNEGADDENAILHITEYHSVVQCCKQMVAAIIAHAASRQTRIIHHNAIHHIVEHVLYQVYALVSVRYIP